MAHELEMVNGKAQMAYAGKVPWHGLGTKVPEDLTPAQMMKAAGLDWSVKKAPLMFNGNQVAGDKMALYRESDNDVQKKPKAYLPISLIQSGNSG